LAFCDKATLIKDQRDHPGDAVQLTTLASDHDSRPRATITLIVAASDSVSSSPTSNVAEIYHRSMNYLRAALQAAAATRPKPGFRPPNAQNWQGSTA
jgi:hypothetical protein